MIRTHNASALFDYWSQAFQFFLNRFFSFCNTELIESAEEFKRRVLAPNFYDINTCIYIDRKYSVNACFQDGRNQQGKVSVCIHKYVCNTLFFQERYNLAIIWRYKFIKNVSRDERAVFAA